jgi:hypothetical protein
MLRNSSSLTSLAFLVSLLAGCISTSDLDPRGQIGMRFADDSLPRPRFRQHDPAILTKLGALQSTIATLPLTHRRYVLSPDGHRLIIFNPQESQDAFLLPDISTSVVPEV